jgi:hypothetical protein
LDSQRDKYFRHYQRYTSFTGTEEETGDDQNTLINNKDHEATLAEDCEGELFEAEQQQQKPAETPHFDLDDENTPIIDPAHLRAIAKKTPEVSARLSEGDFDETTGRQRTFSELYHK